MKRVRASPEEVPRSIFDSLPYSPTEILATGLYLSIYIPTKTVELYLRAAHKTINFLLTRNGRAR